MFKNTLKKHPHLVAISLFVGFSLLLLVPHIVTRGMVTGADLIFHYNRFYDAAMQMKEGNFSYIISLYGYQQSGRIVNALYGPYFAYLQGALVLLSGTWFRYQILSNLLLGTLSATSLYLLMRELKVNYWHAISLSMFFVTTYSIQYWWATQGFTSWGVALFPLCLIPAVRFLQTKKVPIFLMAGAVGLMLQVHMLSTLFLVIAYGIIFLIGWMKSHQKLKIIRDVVFSVGIFLLLTINIWLPLIYINGTNTLVPPFVNKKFVLNTVTWLKTAFLYYPYPLPLFFGIYLYFLVKNWKKQSVVLAGLALTYAVLLILSTNLFPWQLIAGKGITIVELIQFPFRFFLYANALLLAVVGVQVSGLSEKLQKIFSGIIVVSLLIGAGFLWRESYKEIEGHYYSDTFLQKRIHTTLFGTTEELRASFHSNDLGEFIQLAQKSTPDYVPHISEKSGNITNEESDNTYFTYRDEVILPNQSFDKQVDGNRLVITWTANEAEDTAIPIIVYQDSQLVLNHQVLNREDIKLSTIGVPTVKSQKGQNSLVLSYKQQWWLLPVIAISLMGWGLWLCYYMAFYRKSKLLKLRIYNETNQS
ncbi:hypothetical protein [Streptococcus suis]|uniref:hypothetical protein n=1 Tax=Streptococcus suis TaxID=1307 RepID=UPI001C9504EB|nr:hypothetical protein [Streptococcus suis]MBY5010739.1 hypothetical protein [Streptococcus suis]MDG4519408.1 hypothetical protein [Streptococcus suis]